MQLRKTWNCILVLKVVVCACPQLRGVVGGSSMALVYRIESQGQNQIDIRSVEVAKASAKFADTTVIGGILAEETNKLYQRNSNYRKFIERVTATFTTFTRPQLNK